MRLVYADYGDKMKRDNKIRIHSARDLAQLLMNRTYPSRNHSLTSSLEFGRMLIIKNKKIEIDKTLKVFCIKNLNEFCDSRQLLKNG